MGPGCGIPRDGKRVKRVVIAHLFPITEETLGLSPFRPGINSGLLLLELLLRIFGQPEAVIAVIVYLGVTGAITPTSVVLVDDGRRCRI